MSSLSGLKRSTHQILAVFDASEQAAATSLDLQHQGIGEDKICIYRDVPTAEKVDIFPEWFDNSDEDVKNYQRELSNGNTVMTISLSEVADRDAIYTTLKQYNARSITHLGDWVTEEMPVCSFPLASFLICNKRTVSSFS